MDALCRVRNKIRYVLSWRAVYELPRVLCLWLFPYLRRNSGNTQRRIPSRAHKLFVTRVHALLHMYFCLTYCKPCVVFFQPTYVLFQFLQFCVAGHGVILKWYVQETKRNKYDYRNVILIERTRVTDYLTQCNLIISVAKFICIVQVTAAGPSVVAQTINWR